MKLLKQYWLALILLLAALLRLPQLSAPLWNDEAFVWVVSQRPIAAWWAALAGDVHPPLWYAVEWIVARLTPYPLALRLFPFACGLAVVYLGARIVRALGAPLATQILTAVILALMPQQIYYSAEVRMYSLLAALYLAGMWCVLSKRWGWFTVCLTAMLYTHHYGWIYAATLGMMALWKYRQEWPAVVAHGGLAMIAYMPILPLLRLQLSHTGSYWAGLGWDGVVLTPALWFAGAPLDRPALGGALIVASLALIMAAVWRAIVHRHYTLLWLVAGPLLIALALSPFKNVWLTRAFIGSGATAAVLLAVEFTQTRRATWTAAGLILPMLLVGALTDQTRSAINDRYATPTVAAYLRSHLQPGDAVLCFGSAAWMELQPYQLPAIVSLDETGDWLATGGLSDETREALGVPPITGEVKRVWIFAAQLPGGAFDPVIPAGARKIADYAGTEKVFSSHLYLLEDLYGYAGR
jgi:mannosyltransferase